MFDAYTRILNKRVNLIRFKWISIWDYNFDESDIIEQYYTFRFAH